MVEFNAVYNSSRRSSIASQLANDNVQAELNIFSFNNKQWFDTFKFFKSNDEIFLIKNQEIFIDALKVLCDDNLSNQACIYLLTLFEIHFDKINNVDLLEQIIGSLINIFSTKSLNHDVKNKYLYTITTLILSNDYLDEKNNQIEAILDIFLKILFNNLKNTNDFENGYNSSCECLFQIEKFYPGTIKKYFTNINLNPNNLHLISILINNKQLGPEDIKEITLFIKENNDDSILICRVLEIIYKFIKENPSHNLLTPSIFKPFTSSLIYSSEVCCFHLALLLFNTFELVFDSENETYLISQLNTLCIHPSLLTAQRLLILDFTRTLFSSLKLKHFFDPKQFEICDVLDGPDTQEKKLQILLQAEINDETLLQNLKPLKNLTLIKNNKRASDSLYRILNTVIEKKYSMKNKVEYLIVSMILKCPSQNICRTISLLKLRPELSENIYKIIIEEAKNHSDNFQDELDLKEYFVFFEWILNNINFEGEDENSLTILNFAMKKAETRKSLHKNLLACCSAVIRNQFLSDSVKKTLNQILTFLIKTTKNNIELVSWAQIFSIAINTLPNQENFNTVFSELKIENNQLIKLYSSKLFPIQIEKVKNKRYHSYCEIQNKEVLIPFILKISKNKSCKDKLEGFYCVNVIVFNEKYNIKLISRIAYLNEEESKIMTFELNQKETENFDLFIKLRFTDHNGIIHISSLQKQTIEFNDFCMPTNLNIQDFDNLWNFFTNDDNDSPKCALIMSQFTNFEEFYSKFNWISYYIIKNHYFVFALPTSNIVLMKIYLINSVINLRIVSNNLDSLNCIYNKINNFLRNYTTDNKH